MICIFALMLCFTEMEDDEELERMMLSISHPNSKANWVRKPHTDIGVLVFVVYGDKICLMTWVWQRYYNLKVVYEDTAYVPVIQKA